MNEKFLPSRLGQKLTFPYPNWKFKIWFYVFRTGAGSLPRCCCSYRGKRFWAELASFIHWTAVGEVRDGFSDYRRYRRTQSAEKIFCQRYIETMKNKARHNLSDAKCRWRSDRLDDAVSFWEPLGDANPPEGDTKPPGGNNPWFLLFSSSIGSFWKVVLVKFA